MIDSRVRPAEVGKFTVYSVAILAVLLIGYILVHAMRAYVPTQAINAKRAAERLQARKDIEAATKAELEGDPVYINKNNGVVRLPITRATELYLQNGKNLASFRSNLLARVDKATAAPPKAPEKPSQFE